MRPMTNAIRNKISVYRKNKIDISELIKDVEIRGENLSYAIIKDFYRVKTDISNCNFSNAIIGEENKVTMMSNTNMKNCVFKSTKFLGKIIMRRCDARGSNFTETFMPNIAYEYSDFRGCNFCSCIFRIGSREGLGAIFDKKLWVDLTKGWVIK